MSDASSAVTPESSDPKEVAIQSPLTLIMKIKSEADYEQLHTMLKGIQAMPPAQNPIWKALEQLNKVHFARFVFLDKTRLAVITTYDGKFEDYIADFTRVIGPVFDNLLKHMEDAPKEKVQDDPKAFLKYVFDNDLRGMPPFYSAFPNATVSDIKAALEEKKQREEG